MNQTQTSLKPKGLKFTASEKFTREVKQICKVLSPTEKPEVSRPPMLRTAREQRPKRRLINIKDFTIKNHEHKPSVTNLNYCNASDGQLCSIEIKRHQHISTDVQPDDTDAHSESDMQPALKNEQERMILTEPQHEHAPLTHHYIRKGNEDDEDLTLDPSIENVCAVASEAEIEQKKLQHKRKRFNPPKTTISSGR